MGFGAYMLVVNNDVNNHSINIHNRNNMYDNGDEGSNISYWDNSTISVMHAMPSSGMQYIEAKGDASFDLTVDGLTTLTISQNNNAYDIDVDNDTIDITWDVNNIGNGSQAFITIVINNTVGYADWMYQFNNHNSSFFSKKLNQVCLPGAHDAGMSVLKKSTNGSNECNTQTQINSIGDQLQKGTRYFDLRPAIWKSSDTTMYMGHFSRMFGAYFGSIGQSLSDVLDEVATFMSQDSNGHEIVVLKFSHYTTQDDSGFSGTLLSSLITQVKNKLSTYMYTNTDSSINLGNVTLNDIKNSGKRVVCVFDNDADEHGFSSSDYTAVASPYTGIFSFGSNTSSKNFRLYDEYANDHDYDDMVNDQVTKWDNFSRDSGALFLFSYTLTSTSGGYIANAAEDADGDYIQDCVLDMAEDANPVLLANLAYYKAKKDISEIPNILYIDRVNSHHPINEAMYINKLFA